MPAGVCKLGGWVRNPAGKGHDSEMIVCLERNLLLTCAATGIDAPRQLPPCLSS